MAQSNGRTNIRTFIAIPLPEKVILFLMKLQEEIKAEGVKASWSRMEGMHLTLKFIGETSPESIDTIRGAMETAAENSVALSLSAGGVGVFPSVKKARVVYAGIKGETHRLAALHKNLDADLAGQGFKKEAKRFAPHLTLARIKTKSDPSRLVHLIRTFQERQSERFACSSMTLFKSDLTPRGAIHTELFTSKFGP